MGRRDSHGVRLFTRNGYNFADRFPKIVAALASCRWSTLVTRLCQCYELPFDCAA
jgi:ATP-dependent DNA ligase